MVSFEIRNDCSFEIWPGVAANAGHPVIADGGFFLPPGGEKMIQAPPSWSGRLWARTGCNFSSILKPACQTGDCQGSLACNGTIGLPPATLLESCGWLQRTNIRLIKAAKSKVLNSRMQESVNDVCPQELQVLDKGGDVIACKSACLAFDRDVFCCRESYGSPEKCKPSMYSKLFKEACPSYFSYAYDAPTPLVSCSSKSYVITFCPSKWSGLQSM
ncbi:Thaumatin-like protein [Platanthera guangdongensis]|uniref:Thaumatin-like protein n=1 Tax=Platanthera guangdongensis TaxID=2320717 RepID=A0ABR2LC18_9ASPA